MSEKNQPPQRNNILDHNQYENLPPPPAYSPPSYDYRPPPMNPTTQTGSSSGSYGELSGNPQQSPYSRGYPSGYQSYPPPPSASYHPRPTGYPAPGGYPSPSGYSTGSAGSSSNQQGGLLGGLFSNSGSMRNPLDPPAECLSRPPRFHQQPAPFAPMQIPCNGKHLDAGFPLAYPANILYTHDVPEPDWVRFVEDLAISGRLNGGEKLRAGVLPMVMGAGAGAGFLISRGIQRRMKSGKANQVGSLVDIWNGMYFNPRGINITLIHGSRAISGLNVQDCSSSSSDSSSDDEHYSHGYYDNRRDHRRAERAHRREERRERREMKRERKRERKNNKGLPYYLVLEHRPI
ncbi:hypothetical protein Unana1_08263 [Umbelopsis nana]